MVKFLPHIDFQDLHGNKNIQKIHINNILYFHWMQYMEKWFGRWDATHLLHDTLINSSMNEHFF